MPGLKVLIVDDEVVYRAMLTTALRNDPDFAAPVLASEGAMALRCIAEDMPDVVTLDVEMPGMDGLTTLVELRRRHPALPVVVLSGFQRPGIQEMAMLAAGADDCVTKAPRPDGMVNGIAWMRAEIFPRLKSVAAQRKARRTAPQLRTASGPPRRLAVAAGVPPRIDVVAIAASTGGPRALEQVLVSLPADLPVPIVIVQHMPVDFTRLFAERLDKKTPFRAAEAMHGMTLEPGQVWVAPGNHHMVTARAGAQVVLRINQDPPENSCRPAADPLFRSIAETFGAHALAVVMTGMGMDGLRGCRRLSEVGAQIVVQDEASSVVWGMPGAVAGADLADAVIPLECMAGEIHERVEASRRIPSHVNPAQVARDPGSQRTQQ
jgi:two-component system chemotaxis response regulator CheB